MIRFVLAFLLAFCGAANAQLAGGLQFPGPGTPHTVAAAYTGPLDVAGYTSAYGYYGFRCSKTSYTGNVALIKNFATPTTTTLLTCSSGGTINQTLNTLATTCASACIVDTIYNQLGTGSCGNFEGAASNFPPFVLGGGGSMIGTATSDNGASNQFLATAANCTALPQPLTVSVVVQFTATSSEIIGEGNGFAFQALLSLATTTVTQEVGGATVSYSGNTYNVFHAYQSVLTGAASSMKIDGGSVVTASSNPGTNGIAGTGRLSLLSATVSGAAFLGGNFFEMIIAGSAVSTTNQALQATNQCAYFGTSC